MPRTARSRRRREALRPATRRTRSGDTIIDATEPLPFEITPQDITRATCGHPGQCVVAQALRRTNPMIDGFQVGSNITKIYCKDGDNMKVCRYTTPSRLANALKHFDLTGEWGLAPGLYHLLPLSKSYRRANRWGKIRHSGGRQSTYRGTPVAPTRYALTVCQLTARN